MKKIVHVGQMKSGATYLQNACSVNREALFRQGVFYPGPNFNHQHACYGICGKNIPWVSKVKPLWESLGDELIRQLDSSDRSSLISCEALSCLNKNGVEDFVETIGGVDEVVVTIRNFHSVLLSAWQQSVKGGGTSSLPEFFERLKATKKAGDGLWRNYAFGTTVENWSSHAKVTVLVTSGDQVLENFFKILGVEGVCYNSKDAMSGNVSLMREDVELLRGVNRLNSGMSKDAREAYVRYLLEEYFFPAASKGLGSKITLPREYASLVEAWCDEEIEKTNSAHGVRIVGDVSSISRIVEDKLAQEGDSCPHNLSGRLEFHLGSC
ncbi:hypothetical protein [Halomonas organivorans]|uniref:Sulfotransferase domain-containing protein n=1 Tax=Halomonas organivorans TaxID=257772 RepID=A0A7W5C0X2_9GAMM|nr:hypothetical protein [Halomonas organivorans]MBB3142612.1 hypothetical protein [Halomonas organivorans]